MKPYRVIMHPEAFDKAEKYLAELRASGISAAGNYLKKELGSADLSPMDAEEFIEHLAATKRPQIFAESAVYGEGSDWNRKELSILGDIGIAAEVTVFDNGMHHNPVLHSCPFPATLLYTPGALLRNGTGNTPADWNESVRNRKINPEGYGKLYERRLLPLLIYADRTAGSQGKKALITIPGLGCGQFAGPFIGQMGENLKIAIAVLLEQYTGQLKDIKAVYYDPFQECINERIKIGSIHFLVRPFKLGNYNKPQLCMPAEYQDAGDDFGDCLLFSVVAWDHVSWPGNDFYTGSRATDDGVKAAATSSMRSITGVTGTYSRSGFRYNPPAGFHDWKDVVLKNSLRIEVKGNLSILPDWDI
jgi:hypothetical protein